VFFLDILERRGALVRVQNIPSAGRNIEIPRIEAWIEEGAVRPLLRGEDVQPDGAEPKGGLLFFHDADHLSRPLPDGLAASRFPAAYAFAKKFEPVLRARHRFRNFDPQGDDWLGIYSVTQAAVADHKVVFREISQTLIAASVHSASVIPDHKLYVIHCSSADEADWLAEVMNSDLVGRLAQAFALTTSIGGSLLRYIGIRQLSGQSLPPPGSQRLAKALGLRRPQLEVMRKALVVVSTLDEV
jgi:hypothetical protein